MALLAETVLDLAAAAKIIPPAKGRRSPDDHEGGPAPRGKKTHLSTILRWILKGARDPVGKRVRLEAVRLGGRWLTSREALERFAMALTARVEGDDEAPAVRTPTRRRQASERAAKELERLGI